MTRFRIVFAIITVTVAAFAAPGIAVNQSPWDALRGLAVRVLALEAHADATDARIADLERRVAMLERARPFKYCVRITPNLIRCSNKKPPDNWINR